MGILSNDLGDSEQRSKDEFRAQLDQNGCFKDASGIEHCDKTYFQDGCFRFNDGETHCDNF